ncbi:MAG: RsbRD N-terminal domain-containing protein [Chloroflexi bacterium]|nr:RsbRD N-terminal domain-containing protein [Chloroflexota bacterium]
MLETILAQKKKAIVGKWLELIADSYPAGSEFFVDKDQFTNPVGYILSSEIEILYDEFLHDQIDSERAIISLEEIIRSRAVQDRTPGESVNFVFLLKDVIRNELKSQAKNKEFAAELAKLEGRIDNLACQAFNVYTGCRERINQIRINEIKRDRDNANRLLERFARKYGDQTVEVAGGYDRSEVTE